ncbi:hypothetical protein EPH_0030040 [Eimeria praecox]|uniref:Uncharacterized protein n=1 Tax=Eimeria praecox TaxID=51316 RepID=U6G3A5_9EIME|nr:hypothetical protein EPH_0030040 [Eimeria praecox]
MRRRTVRTPSVHPTPPDPNDPDPDPDPDPNDPDPTPPDPTPPDDEPDEPDSAEFNATDFDDGDELMLGGGEEEVQNLEGERKDPLSLIQREGIIS